MDPPTQGPPRWDDPLLQERIGSPSLHPLLVGMMDVEGGTPLSLDTPVYSNSPMGGMNWDADLPPLLPGSGGSGLDTDGAGRPFTAAVRPLYPHKGCRGQIPRSGLRLPATTEEMVAFDRDARSSGWSELGSGLQASHAAALRASGLRIPVGVVERDGVVLPVDSAPQGGIAEYLEGRRLVWDSMFPEDVVLSETGWLLSTHVLPFLFATYTGAVSTRSNLVRSGDDWLRHVQYPPEEIARVCTRGNTQGLAEVIARSGHWTTRGGVRGGIVAGTTLQERVFPRRGYVADVSRLSHMECMALAIMTERVSWFVEARAPDNVSSAVVPPQHRVFCGVRDVRGSCVFFSPLEYRLIWFARQLRLRRSKTWRTRMFLWITKQAGVATAPVKPGDLNMVTLRSHCTARAEGAPTAVAVVPMHDPAVITGALSAAEQRSVPLVTDKGVMDMFQSTLAGEFGEGFGAAGTGIFPVEQSNGERLTVLSCFVEDFAMPHFEALAPHPSWVSVRAHIGSSKGPAPRLGVGRWNQRRRSTAAGVSGAPPGRVGRRRQRFVDPISALSRADVAEPAQVPPCEEEKNGGAETVPRTVLAPIPRVQLDPGTITALADQIASAITRALRPVLRAKRTRAPARSMRTRSMRVAPRPARATIWGSRPASGNRRP